jgi:hypothetical protein
MTWEFLSQGRWALATAVFAAIGFPLLIVGGIMHAGRLPSDDGSLISLQFAFALFNALMACAISAGLLWPMNRLFVAPAPTATLVTWRMIPAAVFAFLETAAMATTVNVVLRINSDAWIDWPVWGPAVWTAVATAWCLAIVWALAYSRWSVPAMSLAAAALILWFDRRHGRWGEPCRPWPHVTAGEGWTMALAGVLAYVVAVRGVTRNRRGEPPVSLGIVTRVARWLDQRSLSAKPFASAAAAQQWSDWQTKAYAAPATIMTLWLFGAGALLFGQLSPWHFAEASIDSGWILLIAGTLGGIVLGTTGNKRSSFIMTSHLATQPTATPEMARRLLKVAAQSTLMAWGLWVATVALVLLVVFLGWGTTPPLGPERAFLKRTLLGGATLVGLWIMLSTATAIGLAGRPRLAGKLFGGWFTTVVTINILTNLLLSRAAAIRVTMAFMIACCALIVAGVAWLYRQALNRDYVSRRLAAGAFLAWATLPLTLAWVKGAKGPDDWAALMFLSTMIALAVAAPASFPLAIHVNRVR